MTTLDYPEQIAETISNIGFTNQNMGIHGIGGSFFLFENLKATNNFSLELFCENAYQWKFKNNSFSFCSGGAGVNWMFTYMVNKKLLSISDYNFLCSDDNLLLQKADADFERNNFDFLHGGIGIAWYVIYKNKLAPYKKFLSRVIEHIERYMHHEIKIKKLSKSRDLEQKVNLSVSHGITSILKYCLQCFKRNINAERSKAICLDIISFLVNSINENHSESYFPTFISNEPNENYSRLAWCYGDLTTAYIMLQVADCFNLVEIKKLAFEILNHASKRRGFSETGVVDAGICHGTAGNAYVFHKLFQQKGGDLFLNARDYWLDKTYEFARTHRNSSVHFPQYNTITNEESLNHSFLEGSCGVGLVLSSIFEGCCDWDYCIMLND